MKPAAFICGFVLFLSSNLCAAYEPDTHRRLSDAAASASVLVQKYAGTNTNVLDDLGLKGYLDDHQQFLDSQVGESIYLDPDKQDLFKAATTGNVQYLIQAGAALEDEGFRALCHFYDPLPHHIPPLSTLLFTAKYSAPEWATGYTDSGALADGVCQFGPVWSSPQLYSLRNGEDYFYKALTLPSESDRNLQFGNLFLSLGHAMHLLQDTSVPQHVRNDMHCDDPLCKIVNLYRPSKYESYTYYSAPIGSSTYGSVIFPDGDAQSFWSNDAGSGIAQFTNVNFLSVRTMAAFGAHDANAEYPMPVWNGAASVESIYDVYQELNQPVPQQVASACPQESTSTPCDVTFLASTGTDQYTGSSITNPRAATRSLFDEDMKAKGDTEVFALNRVNYQAAWGFLIPRAIAYSTGLINHFFRGRLDVQPDPDSPGGYLVINKSSYPMSDGTLTLYYDDADGNRYPVPGASWSSVTIPAAGSDAAAEYPIKFSAPMDPAPATSGEYILVFQGKIGSEVGVAAKLFTEVSSNYVYAGWNSSNCGWFGSCTSGVKVFDSTFNLHSASPLGLPIYNLVVFDGKEYALVESPNCAYSVLLEGVAIADSTLTWCGNRNSGEVFDIDTLGVNSHYLYIFKSNFTVVNTDSGQRMNYNYESVDRYDHKGNYVSTIAKLPVGTIGEASVNDTRMCLAAWSADFASSVALLADLDGNTVANFPLTNQSDYVSCALAADRAYVLDDPFEGGDPILNVYDMNGSAKASFTISGIKNYALWGVFAHNSYIYVMVVQADYSNSSYVTFIHKAAIYDREVTRDSEGNITSESFSRRPDVTIPELPYSYGINFALDMKDVLGALKN